MSTSDNERELERLEQLQAAWDSVTPPQVDRELEDEHALTRATVAWMRGAYAAVEPSQVLGATGDGGDEQDCAGAEASGSERLDQPTTAAVVWMQGAFSQVQVPELPVSPAARTHQGSQAAPATKLRLLPALVAGLAAAGLIAYLFGPGSTGRPGPIHSINNETSVEVALGPDTTPPDSPESIPVQPPTANQQDAVVTTDIVDGRIEMRSGPVRLQLFSAVAQPQPDETQGAPETSSETSELPTTESQR
ncbi:MAG: hypothetical protein ACI8Q9_002637 [Planctomycetota bacterium]|jgi:hypothetical protein